jgi:molecular chaperone DnaK (HSP70)
MSMAPKAPGLGVDFGTSNTAAGFLQDGRPHLISFAPGQTTIPTTFFFDFDTRKMLIGEPASPNWCSFRTPMICSSVNLLRFMSVSFDGEQTNLKVRRFRGAGYSTSTCRSLATISSRLCFFWGNPASSN